MVTSDSGVAYDLSDNDKHEIAYFCKHYKKQEGPISSLAEKALVVISRLYGGLHNMPWEHKEKFDYYDNQHVSIIWFGGMATFDSDKLTTLVFLAHELALRIEVSPRAFRYLKISFWERKGRTGSLFDRHPSIDEVISFWRK